MHPHPSLTVRSFAEMLPLPALEQTKILALQKYPDEEPARPRVPYYGDAKSTIRRYFRSCNDQSVVEEALSHLAARDKPTAKARAEHNSRVLDAFLQSPEARRQLVVHPFGTRYQRVHGVDLRLTFDLVADERGRVKFKYYNFRIDEMDDELARTTLELSSHILEQQGVPHRMSDLELYDFETGKLHRHSRRRKRTIARAKRHAELVETLWPTI